MWKITPQVAGPFLFDPFLADQVVQMCQTFTGGKPFLGIGELFPVPGPDPPCHTSGYFISCPAWIFPDDFLDFIQTLPVMGQQLPDPLEVISAVSVAGQSQSYIILSAFPQTGQIGTQGILHTVPGDDIR